MKKNFSGKNFPMNIGLSSVLLIFVVLCLVSFSVLSIVSSNADYQLSRKVQERSLSYYDACNQAQDTLLEINTALHELYDNSASAEEYATGASLLAQEYHYSISDLQELVVTLEYPYPDTSDDIFYRITSWQVVNTQDIEYDEHLNVIE